MKVLATIKPVNYLKDIETFAYLIELDFSTSQISRKIKLPAASFKTKSSFMTNFVQGMVVVEKEIFVAYWNYIVIIDYDTFTIKDAFSHPLMTDNHGIDSDGQRLYVTSTAIDTVLGFDIKSKKLIFSWGASNKFLQPKRFLVPYSIANNRIVKKWNVFAKKFNLTQLTTKFNKNIDYRSIHKSNSVYHNHHINDVCCVKDNIIYLTTKGWNDFENGSIIKLNIQTGIASFISKPGSFKGLHDCILVDTKIMVTESSKNSVGIQLANGKIEHKILSDEPFFIRGLVKAIDGFVVGFSSVRFEDAPEAKVVYYDSSFDNLLSSINLGTLYKHSKVAVHSIQLSPTL